MADSYTAELRDIIDRAFEHGARATAQMVHNSVYRDLPEHLVDHLIGKGLRSQVTAYFNAKNADGLPMRPEANPDGEHADIALLSVEECGYVYASYRDRAEANLTQAEKVRKHCLEMHGVDLAQSEATA